MSLIAKMKESGFRIPAEKLKYLLEATKYSPSGKSKYLSSTNISIFREAVPYLTGYFDSYLWNIAKRYGISYDEFICMCKNLYKLYNPVAIELAMPISKIYLPEPIMYSYISPFNSVFDLRYYYESVGNFYKFGVDERLNQILCNILSKPKLDSIPDSVSYIIFNRLLKQYFTGKCWSYNYKDAKVYKTKAAARKYFNSDRLDILIPVKS